MLDIALRFLALILYTMIWLFLAFAEYLDWHGRMEMLEKKHPTLAKLVPSRRLRLVLLMLILGMLLGDLSETLKQVDTEPFVIRVNPGPLPDAGAKNAEILILRAQLASLVKKERPDSLRRRTIKLVNELNLFWSQRSTPQQVPVQNPATDEDRKRNAAWDSYWREARADYTNRGYSERILGIIREYKIKGVPTGYLEQGAEQPDRLIGSMPFGGYSLENCDRYANELCQLRELAFHVNARDQRAEPPDF